MDSIKNFFRRQIEQKYLSDDVFEQIKDFNCRHLTKEQKLLIDKLITNEELKERYKKYGLCKECKQPNNGGWGVWWCQSCDLSNDVIRQIKDFKHLWLTEEQKLLIDKLITNEELKERYKKYGLCRECKQPNTGYQYCQSCNLSDDVIEQIKDFKHLWLTEEQKLLIDKLITNEKLKERYKRYGLCKECNTGGWGGWWCQSCNLSHDVIEQIKDFEHWNLTKEQKLLIDELISNEKLKERYKKYGLCKKCKQPNTDGRWCRSCNANRFRQNWTSRNLDVNELINESQFYAKNKNEKLEWIEYDRFEDIKYIDKGGFGTIYKAFWKDGPIEYWDYETNQWNRSKYHKSVALKSLNNSKDITLEFLNEVIF
ncbi:hypothetical protein C1645_160393 [Glomus cerebriforme]|uniref:Protein kinase domain-containing protein n=1 Tax=Glomus cerebriforme TaxID=658196 RepID=A0A397SVL7_9GLOM|nr:hypothetical protein C1645_160393 [Glomus cerebriforme]